MLCRDILAKLSNDEALLYGRKVRLIVRRLRTEIIDVNEEMKALNRCNFINHYSETYTRNSS